jgi:N-acetylglucosamine kinase-like BadF-type ATPase
MIVVADSGSTKTDWVFIHPDGRQQLLASAGFNPVLHDRATIREELAVAFAPLSFLDQVEKVFFYGSGCWDAKRAAVIVDAIRPYFSSAEILVEHDLLGAARATCGVQPGIACILGTGSNSCLFDGNDITDNVTNLGYLLGDEGSGTHMGKRIIRAYFYREMPADLMRDMQEQFPGGKTDILDKIYESGKPNVVLASFASWIGERIEHPFIQKLVKTSFGEFLDRHVLKYEGHQHLPIHFVGSLAYHFREQLLECCQARNLQPGRIIPKPVDELVAYHLEQIGSMTNLQQP